MISLFVQQVFFVLFFALCNLALFSFSSTFHHVLGYDLNTLEEWLYHNRLFLITAAKVLTVIVFLVLPNSYNINASFFKKKIDLFASQVKKLWIIDSKVWILQFISCIILYALFYNIEINENSTIYENALQQIVLCVTFWFCDLIYVRKIYENNIFIKYDHHKIMNSCLQSSLLLFTTAVVTYLSWFDLLQLYLVLVCIFYLLQSETTLLSGHITLFTLFIFLSLFSPMNFIVNTDEIKFYLIAEGFSLPWSFIFLVYFLIFFHFSRYSNTLYKNLISKFSSN